MHDLTSRLTGVLNLLRGRAANPPVGGLPLKVAPCLDALTHVDSITYAFTHPHIQGAIASFALSSRIAEADMKAWLAGRYAGQGEPEWCDGSNGAPASGVTVSRIRQGLHAPAFGAVIDRDGQVMRDSVGEALYFTPSLAGLPHVVMTNEGPVLSAPDDIPRLAGAGVFMAWGGLFNYGHFLLDCLPALAVLKLSGLLDELPPVAPPLTAWQREGVRLLLGPEDADRLIEIHAPLVAVDDVAFASPMDHFLHAPNTPLDWVREQMLANIGQPDTGLRRIYVTRRGDDKRPMINEAELEAALEARGFTIVRPEDHSVAEQIALFRDADVVVAPTGAALANILFCKPTAKIFEIQPTNFVGIWTRSVAYFVGSAWYCFYAPSPIAEREIVIEGQSRPGLEFLWRTPLEDFLVFLDDNL